MSVLPADTQHLQPGFRLWPPWLGARRLSYVLLAIASLVSAFACVQSARKTPPTIGSVISAYWMDRAMAGEPRKEGAFNSGTSPGYALVMAAIARVTPATSAGMRCWLGDHTKCRSWMVWPIVVVQFLAAMVLFVLAYALAYELARRKDIALATAVLSYVSMRPGAMAGAIDQTVWLAVFLLLYLYLLVSSVTRGSHGRGVASGAVLAGVVLIEPLAIVLVPLSALQLAVCRPGGVAARSTIALIRGVLFLAATICGIGGLLWLAVRLGYDPASAQGNIAAQLAQRMGFVGIERSAWLATIATSVPFVGDLLANMLSAGELRRIGIGLQPGALVHDGMHRILPDAITRSDGTLRGAIGLMLSERLVGRPLDFALSTVPLLVRGVFAGAGIVALIGVFHVRPMLRYARAEGRLSLHLLVVVPLAAMLIVNALLTPNAFWLNPALPVLYAYAIAYVASGW